MRELHDIYDLRPDIENAKTRQRKSFPEIVEPEFWDAFETAKPYSMLHVTGFYNLYQSLRYLGASGVPGDLVECGTLLGGSSIFMALVRSRFGLGDRTLHVFDTFFGFPEGSTDTKRGAPARGPRYQSFFEAAKANFEATCGTEGVEFHVGPVEETLDAFAPPPLALVRLDTDYYDSTRKELDVLYPHLSDGGVLIIDDYGYYDGCRRATEEYLGGLDHPPLLNRIDPGVWAGVKPGSSGI
jgi:hypothetical protein